jgi:DNA-binding NarL/FixJ family response regulator
MPEPTPPAAASPLTVLIVDDNRLVRAALRDWLADLYPGSRLLEAGSGEDAVRITLAERPTLVLMDIDLPQISGLEATRWIKMTAPETLVVILSVHEANDYRAAAADAGANAYVPKRATPAELLPVLTHLLGEHRQSERALD